MPTISALIIVLALTAALLLFGPAIEVAVLVGVVVGYLSVLVMEL